ncbi:nuclear transport factor 2 family protein [Rhodoblastus sp. 17X3]|uniref:nuclear transport factor 2 family protein n=1 Tax=Rhodoblastus sp. 17X3 TaxID=3047026 RepID=UPI0024B6823E|nr:nuclear transport factor 2 family protein [Rhodoblastus sp. 17X3]MDI9848894.1 nuclear transport factor 2 family protein [Rhodoblastus sp. 17X3]
MTEALHLIASLRSENVQSISIVRAFYERLTTGDVDGLTALLAPDLEWTELESFPYYSGTWRTPDEVLEKLLVPLSRDWADFSVRPSEFIGDADRIVTIGAYAGVHRATGKAMRAAFAHLWRVRQGKIVRFDMVADASPILSAMA